MNSIRILSNDVVHALLSPGARRAMSSMLHVVIVDTLDDLPTNTGVCWLAPFEARSAINQTSFTVEVELPKQISVQKLDELADLVLGIFDNLDFITAGMRYAILVKMPERKPYWKERGKA